MNARQRPKHEAYDGFVFIVMKMLDMQPARNEVIAEQISILISRNCVITFQEAPGDVLDALRDRIRGSKGRIRGAGPDYLANCILDAILDGYYAVLDDLSDRISDMEERLIEKPGQDLLQGIYAARRESLLLRKYIRPAREIVAGLERNESGLVRPETSPYIRDLYDHSLQIIETMESLRDSITGMLEMYLSSASNRMNEVMKVLTIIATIFIPLTFIAGVYGMNLPNMPEMQWRYSYPAVWAVMLAVGGGMLWFFYRKKWI
jgi:magnesium transporter